MKRNNDNNGDSNIILLRILPDDIMLYIFELTDKVTITVFFLCSWFTRNILSLLYKDTLKEHLLLTNIEIIEHIVYDGEGYDGNSSINLLKWADRCLCMGLENYIIKSYDRIIVRGDLETTKWLIYKKKLIHLYETTFDYAVQSGNIDFLTWLKKEDCPYSIYTSWCTAAFYGHLHVLKWFKEEKGFVYPFDSSDNTLTSYTAKGGQFEVLKWLRSELNCSWNKWTLINASTIKGNLEMVKWIIEQGCPCSDDDIFNCKYLLHKGQLEILKWLHEEKGFLLSEETFQFAISYEYIELLSWLKEKNCPWNEEVGLIACVHGDIETLKWLREHNCQLNERFWKYAYYHEQLDILKWLREQGYYPLNT